MNDKNKFIGAHVPAEFHKKVKMQCINNDINIQQAIIKGLCELFDIELDEELLEEKSDQ